MKQNAERAMMLVSQAIKLCDDFALSGAKSHLCAAMSEMTKVNKKRERREINQQQLEKQKIENKLKEDQRRKTLREQLEKQQMDTNIEGWVEQPGT
jgi:vacuolar-type H+-ATPase subunit I/STV1